MVANKIVLVLLLALAATQAAPQLNPKDLRVVIVKFIKIFDIMGEKLATGIADAKPTVLELEAELNPALAANVHDLLSKLEDDVNQIVDRLNTLEDEVFTALGKIETEAASCISAADASLDKVLDVSEKALSDAINALLTKYDSNITSVRRQVVAIIKALDDATDLAIATGVACIKKGSKTVKECLDANSEAWKAAVTQAVVDGTLLLNEVDALLQAIFSEAIEKLKAIGAELHEKADPTWVAFGKCVAALS